MIAGVSGPECRYNRKPAKPCLAATARNGDHGANLSMAPREASKEPATKSPALPRTRIRYNRKLAKPCQPNGLIYP
jgi:hypothetical protein